MLIVCPNCATSYNVEPSSLGANGRSVRCVRCRTIWFVRGSSTIAAAGNSPSNAEPSNLSVFPIGEPTPTIDDLQSEPPVAPGEEIEIPHAAPAMAIAIGRYDDEALKAEATPAEDIETSAARRERREAAMLRSVWVQHGLPIALLVLVALNCALIGWRADVVRLVPQTASLYAAIGLPVNVRGLTFSNIAITTEKGGEMPVLVIEGVIVGVRERVVEVPRLRFAVRDRNGQEIYAWTALLSRSVLAPGESLPFRSRLASPPTEGHDVLVRFFHRRDRMAGIQ